jgi:hypothetical protein
VDDIGCDFNCGPGEDFNVCKLQGEEGQVMVGAMICADREFPEAGAALMLKGAEIIVVPNSCEWNKLRSSLLEARAFENQLAIRHGKLSGIGCGPLTGIYRCGRKNGVPGETLIGRRSRRRGVGACGDRCKRYSRFPERGIVENGTSQDLVLRQSVNLVVNN